MKKVLLISLFIAINLHFLSAQSYLQTTTTNPGTIDIKHNGALDANYLKLRYFFSLYSNASGYTNRRLSIQNIDGEQAYIYNYDEGSKTYHTINIGGVETSLIVG